MDPNEALQRLRDLATVLIRKLDSEPAQSLTTDDTAVSDMCDTFVSLDEWLSSGGFKPTDWK